MIMLFKSYKSSQVESNITGDNISFVYLKILKALRLNFDWVKIFLYYCYVFNNDIVLYINFEIMIN